MQHHGLKSEYLVVEINGPNNPFNVSRPTGPQGPDAPKKTEGTDKTAGKGFGDAMQGPRSVGGSSPTQPTPSSPEFDAMMPVIRDGIDQGLGREQIVGRVVADQLQRQFGESVTPEMTQAVAERFDSDPNLSQIFDTLYAEAKRQNG